MYYAIFSTSVLFYTLFGEDCVAAMRSTNGGAFALRAHFFCFSPRVYLRKEEVSVMKQVYETARVEVLTLDVCDIITTSNELPDVENPF